MDSRLRHLIRRSLDDAVELARGHDATTLVFEFEEI
jgi:hypothetical protein